MRLRPNTAAALPEVADDFKSFTFRIRPGILFAVHPLHTEAVANTVGRAELLATLWSLLALVVVVPLPQAARTTIRPRNRLKRRIRFIPSPE